MKLVPLGDQAVLAYFENETDAVHFCRAVQSLAPYWLTDVIAAYSSVAVFFSLQKVTYDTVAACLREQARKLPKQEGLAGPLHRIPCCYEMQKDLHRVSEYTGLSREDIVRCHVETEYTVFAIGFCPGFPFLGYLRAPLTGVPRLQSPRLRVPAGSVGITGRQTGIYPLETPGGWNLIGRTPFTIADVGENYFPIRVGDRVRFHRIDDLTFRQNVGERLPSVVR